MLKDHKGPQQSQQYISSEPTIDFRGRTVSFREGIFFLRGVSSKKNMVMLRQHAWLKNLKSDMDPGVIVSLIGAEPMCDADCCHYIHILLMEEIPNKHLG